MTRTLWGLPDIEFKSEEPKCSWCMYLVYRVDDEEASVCAAAGCVIIRDTNKRDRNCPLRKVERTLDDVTQKRRGQFEKR